ncbi:hypothetical protein F5883DRAFT_586083 [Diaporthe sp. PMI_573]|nr:hypothetical protein F5883DRAFT_586083 [Diaporthaceae sp. PMI_573]
MDKKTLIPCFGLGFFFFFFFFCNRRWPNHSPQCSRFTSFAYRRSSAHSRQVVHTMISSSALPSRSLPAIFPFIRRLSMLLLGPVCCSSAAWALFALETHDEVDFCLFRLWLSCTIRWTASSLLNCLLLDLVAWVSAVWCADRAASSASRKS